MSNKIYVGNLNYKTSEKQLEDLFGQYGEVVNVNIIVDRYTDQSKGFGFVEMAESNVATAAISGLNGQEFDGRALRVDEAKERKPRNNY